MKNRTIKISSVSEGAEDKLARLVAALNKEEVDFVVHEEHKEGLYVITLI